MRTFIFIKGTTGVGKSTAANTLVKLSPNKRIHLDGDVVIPYEELIKKANESLDGGMEVIVTEWFYPPNKNLEFFLGRLKNVEETNVNLIELIASLGVCLLRNKSKRCPIDESTVKEHYRLSKTTKDSFNWRTLNTDNATPDSTAKEIEKIVSEI